MSTFQSQTVDSVLEVREGNLEVLSKRVFKNYRETKGDVLKVSAVVNESILFTSHWHFLSCWNFEVIKVIEKHWPFAVYEGVRLAKLIKQTDKEDLLNVVYSLTWPNEEETFYSPEFVGVEYFKREIISLLYRVPLDEVILFPIEKA